MKIIFLSKTRINAHALFFAIALALILAILCSSVIAYAFLEKKIQLKQEQTIKLIESLQAAQEIQLAHAYEETINFSDYLEESPTVNKSYKTWGIYPLITLQASYGRDTLSKSFLGAYDNQTSDVALYLEDQNRPLSVCGKTKIVGDIYLPKAGYRRAYIEGKSFTYRSLNEGAQHKSANQLPTVNKELLKSFRTIVDQADSIYAIEELPSRSQAFSEHCIKVAGTYLSLQNKQYKGNIIIQADRLIEVSANTQLESVLLVAPKIVIKRGFEGSLQALASDTIIVEEDCKLNYPSTLGIYKTDQNNVYQAYLQISKGCSVDGCLFSYQNNPDRYMSKIAIQEQAQVSGLIYSFGALENRGKIIGSTYTKRFTLKTNSATYENHLLDASFDRASLPEAFAYPPLLETSETQMIAQWLD